MAGVYDGQPYRILNTLAGGNIPYEDNSGKISILLETLSSASGMYMYDTQGQLRVYHRYGQGAQALATDAKLLLGLADK